MAKYTKCIIKFQRPIAGSGGVFMYNEDGSIMGKFPMDDSFKYLFGDRFKMYCECNYRNSDGFLELKIGKEVDADF